MPAGLSKNVKETPWTNGLILVNVLSSRRVIFWEASLFFTLLEAQATRNQWLFRPWINSLTSEMAGETWEIISLVSGDLGPSQATEVLPICSEEGRRTLGLQR